MTESIALRNRVEHSHERIDALEIRFSQFIENSGGVAEILAKLERLEGEIKAMKMRMGKVKETVG